MINETVLLESKSLRESVAERTEVLDRVKVLSLLPDGVHVTTAMVATYFEVGVEVIRQLVQRHRAELTASGLVVLRGDELRKFKSDNLSLYSGGYPQPRQGLTVFPRRAVLNVAMLLRDSETARQVRVYLLDMEHMVRSQPVDNSVHRLSESLHELVDDRIVHILSKTVVPMFNALIETSGEHRKELVALRADVQAVERKLRQHKARLRRQLSLG
ncbi:restriction endonuclease [Streptomyces sp. V2]|uniref:Restriction endonuclease n=1 Tax=Streptomyces niveiscabiei TaxID=164115 RepID=A0ABW9HTZ1_9ACTN|nr:MULTISPECIES: hypothetical protein [Streptomyces]PWG08725.1 restriction endonuclease [Streptomyces sp. V2]